MSKRIAETFVRLKSQGRAGLIPFLMAGDPDIAKSQAILDALPEAGADLIELGMPFSDPMADGPTIAAAGLRALKSGTTVKKILSMVEAFRKKDSATPLILMGYYNPIYRYGTEKFCADAAKAGVDGLIIVDLPPEEENELKLPAQKNQIDLVRLIAPTSLANRLDALAASASGYVYYISMTGITGAAIANMQRLHAQVESLRETVKLPIAVGFGIKTPEQVRDVAQFSDAVVVGSAFVEVIHGSGGDTKKSAEFIKSLASSLSSRTK